MLPFFTFVIIKIRVYYFVKTLTHLIITNHVFIMFGEERIGRLKHKITTEL